MATRRPLQALRPLPQHSTHTFTHRPALSIRTFTSTSTHLAPSPSSTSTSKSTTTTTHQQRKATWQRAIQPPPQHIPWSAYAVMMRRPPDLAHRLAKDGPRNAPDESAIPPPASMDPTLDPTSVRLTPASPSYFSTQPNFNDDIVHLAKLTRKYASLPRIPKLYAPKSVWKSVDAYRQWVGETVAPSRYQRVRSMLRMLNRILPELRTQEVKDALNAHLKDADATVREREPGVLDEWGRGFGKGRRKTARAVAYLVEGSGEVLVNERKITDVFGRVRDRESALWPLTATGRMSRYNVFAVVRGGGTTGWAEAMALAVAKAVLVHEPGLKPAMRRAGVIRRDPRKVERKKPGHLKARKMPAWVRR